MSGFSRKHGEDMRETLEWFARDRIPEYNAENCWATFAKLAKVMLDLGVLTPNPAHKICPESKMPPLKRFGGGVD